MGRGMKKYFVDSKNYVFENIMVMKYEKPKTLKAHIKSRRTSTFLFVLSGKFVYTMKNEQFDVLSNEICYIPNGAEYTYQAVGDDSKVIQVEFDLYSTENGEKTLATFANKPTKLPTVSGVSELFEDLMGENLGNTFITLSILYKILATFFDKSDNLSIQNSERRKIAPALDYINRHMSFEVSVEELAKLCGLSVPHFRRVFRSLTGKSPIKYKNQVIMKCACKLIKSGNMNVSEISNFLGFSDVYTFSQTFKKEIGVSPTKYL